MISFFHALQDRHDVLYEVMDTPTQDLRFSIERTIDSWKSRTGTIEPKRKGARALLPGLQKTVEETRLFRSDDHHSGGLSLVVSHEQKIVFADGKSRHEPVVLRLKGGSEYGVDIATGTFRARAHQFADSVSDLSGNTRRAEFFRRLSQEPSCGDDGDGLSTELLPDETRERLREVALFRAWTRDQDAAKFIPFLALFQAPSSVSRPHRTGSRKQNTLYQGAGWL